MSKFPPLPATRLAFAAMSFALPAFSLSAQSADHAPPDGVVTGNPGCMLQLAAGLRSRGRGDIPVLHVVEVLDRALSAR